MALQFKALAGEHIQPELGAALQVTPYRLVLLVADVAAGVSLLDNLQRRLVRTGQIIRCTVAHRALIHVRGDWRIGAALLIPDACSAQTISPTTARPLSIVTGQLHSIWPPQLQFQPIMSIVPSRQFLPVVMRYTTRPLYSFGTQRACAIWRVGGEQQYVVPRRRTRGRDWDRPFSAPCVRTTALAPERAQVLCWRAVTSGAPPLE